MAKQLDGAVALITGASSGIGEATARALADAGATVALVARRKDRLGQLANDVTQRGGHAAALEADVTDKVQAQAAVDQTVRAFGKLDILVNNAGAGALGPIENAPIEAWENMIRVNELGVLYMTHAALPHLLRAADGQRQVADVVNISSVAGRIATSGGGVYEMTKFGINAFSESLRQEVTQRHVRVAVVEPGAVATDMLASIDPASLQKVAGPIAGRELLQAEDVADAIRYIVTRPRHVAVNELMVRPTETE